MEISRSQVADSVARGNGQEYKIPRKTVNMGIIPRVRTGRNGDGLGCRRSRLIRFLLG